MGTRKSEKAIGTGLVGPKGQVVIPAKIRALFDIQPGDTIVFLADTRKGIAIVKSEFLTKVAEEGMDIK